MRKLAVFIACLAGCAGGPAEAPADLPKTIAVVPVGNRSGDSLIVSGTGIVDQYVIRAQTVTVPDILRFEAGLHLKERGFDVIAPEAVEKAFNGRAAADAASAAEIADRGGIQAACLYLEIRRWLPEGRVHVKYVVVDIAATLVDPKSKRVIWQAERRSAPVATPGEVMRQAADVTAARKVVAELLEPLRLAGSR